MDLIMHTNQVFTIKRNMKTNIYTISDIVQVEKIPARV